MANEPQNRQQQNSQATPAQAGDRLQEVAFDLFKNSRQGVGSPEQHAIKCFRDGAAFLAAADKIKSGEINIVAIDNNPLDEAYAPNLKKTHPINLMSRQWGNIKKVREFYELVKSPNVTAIEELNWGLPECNTARALFPAVLEKADGAKATA